MEANFDITKMDMEELEGTKAILKKRFPEMIEGYLEDTEMYLKGIEEGLKGGDLEKIAKNAHPLKSSSAVLGVLGVSDIARAMEETAKAGGEIDTIRSFVAPLKEALDYAVPKLRVLLDDAV